MTISSSAYFAMNDLVSAHEAFVRNQPGGRRLIAKFTDWTGTVFQARCFEYADLSGSTLVNAALAASSFKFANLYCASLAGADLRGTNFFRADLRGVELRGAKFNGACLDEADFREASLVRRKATDGAPGGEDQIEIRKVDFSNCTLRRARLGKAKLTGCDFSGANLSGADLGGAELDDVNFDGTILTGVDLKKVKLDPERYASAVLDPSPAAVARAGAIRAAIESAETWAATSGGSGRLFVIEDADLRPLAADFADTHLPMSRFRKVRAIGCDFSKSLLTGSTFEDCDLREVDFSDADLRGVRFANCRMNEAVLRHARFGRVSFGEDGVRDTSFENCTMVNAEFLPGVAERYGVEARFVPQAREPGQRSLAAG